MTGPVLLESGSSCQGVPSCACVGHAAALMLHSPTTTALLMACPMALSTTELWPFSSSSATA